MMTFLAIHGNPGRPVDWNPVATLVSRSQPQNHWISVADDDREIREALEKIATKNTPWCLVGYSWGSYKALKILESYKGRSPERVFLIAPYLVPDSPLSTVARVLMGLPGISDFIIRKSYAKWKDSLLEKSFGPRRAGSANGSETSSDVILEFERWVDQPEVWREAVRRKIEQQHNPLQKISKKVPISILIGDRDQTTSLDKLNADLRALELTADIKTIPGGVHALPWTRLDEVAKFILQGEH